MSAHDRLTAALLAYITEIVTAVPDYERLAGVVRRADVIDAFIRAAAGQEGHTTD